MMSPIPEKTYDQYFDALLHGNRPLCLSIARSLLGTGFTVFDLYEQLFRRTLYHIGDLWSKNMITVADEHIASAITESLIAQLRPEGDESSIHQLRVIIACVSSDLHQIGAKMVESFFEQRGWDTYFLGANMPITDLLNAINSIQPDVVCLSLGLIEHFKTLEITIHEINLNHPKLPVVAGGVAFANGDHPTHDLGRFQNLYIMKSIVQLESFVSQFESR